MKLVFNEQLTMEPIGMDENDDYMVVNEETQNVTVVNSTAHAILDLIKQGCNTMEEVINRLTELYHVDQVVIQEDVSSIIASFVTNGFIKMSDM